MITVCESCPQASNSEKKVTGIGGIKTCQILGLSHCIGKCDGWHRGRGGEQKKKKRQEEETQDRKGKYFVDKCPVILVLSHRYHISKVSLYQMLPGLFFSENSYFNS
jgi:hypothetical protein